MYVIYRLNIGLINDLLMLHQHGPIMRGCITKYITNTQQLIKLNEGHCHLVTSRPVDFGDGMTSHDPPPPTPIIKMLIGLMLEQISSTEIIHNVCK